MSKIQSQGLRIKNLGKARGIKMIGIAKHIGYTKSGFSRKINSKQPFDDFTTQKIAEYLGVKTEFLNDVYHPFNEGDEIPEEMIVRRSPVAPESTTTPPAPPYEQSQETIAVLAQSNQMLAIALANKEEELRTLRKLADELMGFKREIDAMRGGK